MTLKKQWLVIDNIEDAFETDTTYQIEIVLDWLHNKDTGSCKAYYHDFITYKMIRNIDLQKKLIIKTASAISQSFAGKNKSE